jgi:hypothetical protein
MRTRFGDRDSRSAPAVTADLRRIRPGPRLLRAGDERCGPLRRRWRPPFPSRLHPGSRRRGRRYPATSPTPAGPDDDRDGRTGAPFPNEDVSTVPGEVSYRGVGLPRQEETGLRQGDDGGGLEDLGISGENL